MSMRDRRASAVSPSLRFLGFIKQPDDAGAADQELELDERDVVWSSSPSFSSASTAFPSGGAGLSSLIADEDSRSPSAAIPAAARRERQPRSQPYHQSAPVAVPAWSKATADRRRREAEQEAADEEDEEDNELMVPPHEMAARRAAAAASVMEGAGRTLKGRDLRRMRNAVWRTTGFLDL
ncbi:unnamed protein product [Triticum turgidum subsp. durum]|uniref:Uncharacterized protein n=1 Tax=Triticum turgidum subsp. durum TaxID=4567 RepID=A0A9R1RB11_TRITD|nr:unnamed protein product [Triticum turgidum subsp. durum]